MIALGDGNCGKTVRNIAAGYNGDDACSPSVNCGPAAGSGQCKVGPQQAGDTKRWECLWQDNAHTECNAAIRGGGFSETRKHIPKILGCYGQF